MGLGDTLDRDMPCLVGSRTNWTTISAGKSHTLGIAGGKLFAWGNNLSRQLGLPTHGAVKSPSQVGEDTHWTDVSAGEDHSLGICGGRLFGWGSNRKSRLGLGSGGRNTACSPTQLDENSGWTYISAGWESSFAIKEGQLFAWGSNYFGELGLGDTSERKKPVRVGNRFDWETVSTSLKSTFALANGCVFCFGQLPGGEILGIQTSPKKVDDSFEWGGMVAGDSHILAIRNDEVVSYGKNNFGQLGLGDTLSRLSFSPIYFSEQP